MAKADLGERLELQPLLAAQLRRRVDCMVLGGASGSRRSTG
jgi:hypothetical protein